MERQDGAGADRPRDWRRDLRNVTARLRAPTPREVLVAGSVILLILGLLWERCGVRGCPDVERLTSYQPAGASVLLDRGGEEFARLAAVEHEMIALDSLAPHVSNAFLAVEDRRFFEHRGVDIGRVFGAIWANIRAGGFVEGSSTISMQLSRNLFPERIRAREKTLRRKLLEVRMASDIEDRFTKEEILELYLNHIYFGGGAYGIQAASRFWFGKSAAELELHESALLAALPKAPSNYDPRRDADAALARRDLVLRLMANQGRIGEVEADEAMGLKLGVLEEPRQDRDGRVFAPYFVQQVRRQLEARLGEELYARPLRIYTTLDRTAQEAAERELEKQLGRVEQGWYGRFRGTRFGVERDPAQAGTDYLQGAVVVMRAQDGDVLAWVGGRDFDDSRYDRAALARRQAGSAFKPFVYAAALEQGLSPSQPILDEPYAYVTEAGRVWEPRNYSGWYDGPMSMRDALVQSQNIPAVRLAAATGVEHVAQLAMRLGLRGEVPASPVSALGVTTTSAAEMTSAYSAFATLGTRVEPRFVLRVEDEAGEVLFESQPEREQVLEPAVAWILSDMLRSVVDRGTGYAVRRAGYRGPAAGKTGTTSDATDVWFVGYDAATVATVWVGFDEVKPVAYTAAGGVVAAPVWGRVFAAMYEDADAPDWPDAPAGVVVRRIDPESGRVLERGCIPWYDDPRHEVFLESQVPEPICPRREHEGWMDQIGRWLVETFANRHGVEGRPDPDLGMPRLRPAEPASRAGSGRRQRSRPSRP